MSNLTPPERKGDKTRRRMACLRQINRFSRLRAVKMNWQHIWLTNRLALKSTTRMNKGTQRQIQTEHCRLKSGPPLTKGLGVNKNIPVPDTKLTLILRVGFISSHMRADKLLPVNQRANVGPPKISLLHEVNSTPSLIMKPRLILVGTRMTLFGKITAN